MLPGIDAVWGRLKVGSPVHVVFDDAGSKRSIWGLRLGDYVVVTPEQALQARRKNGRFGAMIGLIALLGAGYFLHRARKAQKGRPDSLGVAAARRRVSICQREGQAGPVFFGKRRVSPRLCSGLTPGAAS